MRSRYSRFFQLLIIFGDLLLLNACFLLAGALRFDEIKIQETQYYNYYVQLAILMNVSWLFLTFLFRTYDTRRTLEPRKATGKVLNAYFIHLFILLLFLVSLKKDEYSRLFLTYFYVSFFVTLVPWRFYFLRLLRVFRSRGVNLRQIVVIGEGRVLPKFFETVQHHPEYGLQIAAYFSDKPEPGLPLMGPEDDALSYLRQNPVEELYCAFPPGDERLLRWFKRADENLVRFRVIPDLGLHHASGLEIDFYHDVPILLHRQEPLEYIHNRILKRAVDIAFSLLVIITIFPWLFPILAAGVKLSGTGPVFFSQKRTGLRDDPFTIFKFRSMNINSRADVEQAVQDDERITPFGKFMRRHSLDELPQFFNVLIGDMTVVGPRPHMLAHTEAYRQLIDRYMVRHFAKPGITGLAQVRGLRGETRTDDQMQQRVITDVYYIENWSLLLDFKIIVLTLFSTIKGHSSS